MEKEDLFWQLVCRHRKQGDKTIISGIDIEEISLSKDEISSLLLPKERGSGAPSAPWRKVVKDALRLSEYVPGFSHPTPNTLIVRITDFTELMISRI